MFNELYKTFKVGKKNMFKLIVSVAVGPAGEILVAGSRIQVFSAKGDFTEEINAESKGIYHSKSIDCLYLYI